MQAGTSTSDPLILYTDNTAALTIDTSQNATFAGNISLAGSATLGGNISLTGGGVIEAPSSSGSENLLLNAAGGIHLRIDSNGNSGDDQVFKVMKHTSSVVFQVGETGNAEVAGNLDITAAATRVRIGSTTPPTTSVHPQVFLGQGAYFLGGVSSIALDMGSNLYYDGAWKYRTSAAASLLDFDGSGNFDFYTVASGTANAAATLVQRLHIRNTGEVSIGSSHTGFSGWRVLNIRGDSTGGMLNFENSSGARSYALANQGTGMRYQTMISGGYHRFETDAASYALYIKDNGNVHIGGGNPSELFHVQHGTSNAKILIETDSSTSIPEIQFKSANNEIHRIGVETATGNQGYGGSSAYSLNMFARSGRNIHFGSGTTQHMTIKDNGHVGIGIDNPYALLSVYRNHTDPYSAGSFLDYPTMELKHPSTTGSYNGTRYTNTSGNYEWFAGTEQTASNAADYVFQGYDRGNTT